MHTERYHQLREQNYNILLVNDFKNFRAWQVDEKAKIIIIPFFYLLLVFNSRNYLRSVFQAQKSFSLEQSEQYFKLS